MLFSSPRYRRKSARLPYLAEGKRSRKSAGRIASIRLVLEQLEDRMAPAILTVNTTADNTTDTSVLTLRDAITLVNSGGDPASLGQSSMPAGWASQINTTNPFGSNDTINFNIPGSGVQTISLTSALPAITHPVDINGFSQPGASPNTLPAMGAGAGDNAIRLIILDGEQVFTNIDGLTISAGNSSVSGLVIQRFATSIHLETNGNDAIQGNGLNSGIWVDNVPNNTVGGTTPAARNRGAISITGTGAKGNVVQGNYIDTIFMSDATQTLIGGTTPGAGNVLSGGIGIFSDTGNPNDANVVQGNYVGLDPTGTTAIASGGVVGCGIFVKDSSGNLIGGTTPAARNVVAGFGFGGTANIDLEGDPGLPASNNLVQGNYIGTNAAGTAVPAGVVRPLLPDGIDLTGLGTYGNTIGGTAPGAGNLISGNPGAGIGFFESPGNNVVQSNLIGTDVTGTKAIPNLVGVWVSTNDNQIGGTVPGAANTIAFNNGPGVLLPYAGISNPIEGNSIYGNTSLGIQMGATFLYDANGFFVGIAPGVPVQNDSQGHVGPNNFQNFPALSAASSSSTSTLVSGSFTEAAEPNSAITLDFYANPTADPSGYGQGQTYLGSRTIYTDATGNASFTADLAVGNLATQWISATATDPNGNTSEFSQDIQVTSAPSQTFVQNLPASLPQSSVGPNVMTVLADPNTIGDVLNGLSALTSPLSYPVSFYLNLAHGKYSGQTVSVPAGMTLYINGSQNNQLPTNFDPAQPAFTLVSGNMVISNVTFTSTGDAPTVLVTGGNLTLRHDIVQGPPTGTNAAITVTGGTLDLGTTASPGNNIINVSANGQLVQNLTSNPISAVGDTFESNGTVLPAPTLSFTSLTASVNPSTLNQSVTLTASVRPNGSSSMPTGSVDFFDTTTNTDLGSVSLSAGSASLNTSALAAGNHVIRASYSGDSNFLPSLAVLTQQVHYTFSGFLAPLNQGLAFGAGRTIPIKFQLTDYNGNFITSLSAVTALQVTYPDNSIHAISGLRYDSTVNQFIANWSTKGLAAGNYAINLALADGTVKTVTVQLTANGKGGATQMAAGTDGGDNAGLPDTVLGGDLLVYINDPTGYFTPDELARIQDTINALDALLAPYGVTITEVSDSTSANLILDNGATSACGGMAQGVLGCFNPAGEITMLQGWNWYAGADPTQIGANQYDFQTVVTHEFGHALGLGGDTDPTSPMYETLGTAQIRRVLTLQDLNLADSPAGPDPERAAPAPWTTIDLAALDLSGKHSTTLGYQTGSNPLDASHAALNTILADWMSDTEVTSQLARVVENRQFNRALNPPAAASLNGPDHFWSTITAAIALDKITDLSGDFDR